jgi:1,4-dihydroxy-2-naphthoate octaprenyltransferase
MKALSRRVGLGIAARGDLEDAIEYARLARDAGLEAIWIHDSYFERDAVTFGTAIATALSMDPSDSFRVALGSINPFTRHPVLLAMTGSALDDLLPERIVMAIGSGQPVRLRQMGIPYEIGDAVDRISSTMDELRLLWAGERLPSRTPGLPPIQPMFPPVHRIPLYVAANKHEYLELAGRKADGYLAKPCESIPSLQIIHGRVRAAAVTAGRDPAEVDTAAYLLSLVDKTRREALNRAKREPFVIYMMAILTDVSLNRAGFDAGLRDRIMAAWKAEDYHEAGKLIPDELLDAYMLCGTREDVAAQAMAFHSQTGLDLPLIQPVVQEDKQVRELIQVAKLYAALPEPSARPATAATPPMVSAGAPASAAAGLAAASVAAPIDTTASATDLHGGHGLDADRHLNVFQKAWRRLAAAYEIVRPFAYTVTVVPTLAGGALAAVDGRFSWLPFAATVAAAMLVQSGTNVVNEVFDVRKGIDTITSPRASHAVLKGRFTEAGAYRFALLLFAAGIALGLYLVYLRGPILLLLGAVGVLGGYGYTAPPFEYKYRSLGVPMIFMLMGPLTVVGSYIAVSGDWNPNAVVLSLPIGFLVAAIVHGNDWRDISDDTRAGISTLSSRVGRYWARYAYLGLVLCAYASLSLSIALRALPATTVLALLSLPFLAQVIGSAELGAQGQARAIAKIDLETAHLHLAFGSLLVAGLLLSISIH